VGDVGNVLELFTSTILYAVCPSVERKRESGKSEKIVYQKTRSEKLKGRVRQAVVYVCTFSIHRPRVLGHTILDPAVFMLSAASFSRFNSA